MIKYLIGVILILVLGYGAVEAWPLIVGPSLTLTSPTPDSAHPSGTVLISGTVVRASELTLNGEPLTYDQEGGFSEELTYPAGGSILTFIARDRFGRRVQLVRTVYVPYYDGSLSLN